MIHKWPAGKCLKVHGVLLDSATQSQNSAGLKSLITWWVPCDINPTNPFSWPGVCVPFLFLHSCTHFFAFLFHGAISKAHPLLSPGIRGRLETRMRLRNGNSGVRVSSRYVLTKFACPPHPRPSLNTHTICRPFLPGTLSTPLQVSIADKASSMSAYSPLGLTISGDPPRPSATFRWPIFPTLPYLLSQRTHGSPVCILSIILRPISSISLATTSIRCCPSRSPPRPSPFPNN